MYSCFSFAFFPGEALTSDDPVVLFPRERRERRRNSIKKLHRKGKFSVTSVKVDFQAKSNPERIDSLNKIGEKRETYPFTSGFFCGKSQYAPFPRSHFQALLPPACG